MLADLILENVPESSMQQTPEEPKGLYSHASMSRMTMNTSDETLSLINTQRDVLFWRSRLAALLDVAESDSCRSSAADMQDRRFHAEIAVALDAFRNIRRSAAGWQDIYSADSGLINRALSLLQSVPDAVESDDWGSQSRHIRMR